MDIAKITEKKNLKQELTKEEIDFCIDIYVKDQISDEQMTPFIKSVYDYGMTPLETYYLTKAMQNSGASLNLHKMGVDGVIVDKHSTGGVADTTTLIMVPLLASLGVNVVKMSGGKLGFTGGTSDKIKCFAKLENQLPIEKAVKIIKRQKGVFLTQSQELAPADKKIYELRDKTGLVDSVPLIAASVASKKLAMGADIILIDIKCGTGALIKERGKAKKLANLLMWIFKKEGKKAITVVSQMNRPLGQYVGKELAVQEAILVLRNKLKNNLYKLSIFLCNLILQRAWSVDFDEAQDALLNEIKTHRALNKFMDIVQAQGGSLSLFQEKIPYKKKNYKAEKNGYFYVDTEKIGALSNEFTSKFKQFKGIHIIKTPFEFVKENEIIFQLIYRYKPLQVEDEFPDLLDVTSKDINTIEIEYKSCFTIKSKKPIRSTKMIEVVNMH